MAKNISNYLRDVRDISGDDVLERLGLMRRAEESSGFLPLLLGCGIGVAVGAALGLAFAPKAGAELRGELGEKIRAKAPMFNREEADDARTM